MTIAQTFYPVIVIKQINYPPLNQKDNETFTSCTSVPTE